MAIINNLQYKGLTKSDGYFKVANVDLNKTSMTFNVAACYSQGEDALYYDTYTCDYDLYGKNPIEQAYEHIKSLPKFLDGISDN